MPRKPLRILCPQPLALAPSPYHDNQCLTTALFSHKLLSGVVPRGHQKQAQPFQSEGSRERKILFFKTSGEDSFFPLFNSKRIMLTQLFISVEPWMGHNRPPFSLSPETVRGVGIQTGSCVWELVELLIKHILSPSFLWPRG